MTDSLDGPNTNARIKRLEDRVDDLARLTRRKATETPGYVYWEQTFSQDTVAVSASGRYYPPFTGEIYEALATLKTAGTSTTTVVVKVNGGTQATINLASSDQYELAQLDDTLQDDTDYVTVETTAAGTGAAGLVVTVRFRRRA